jgi:hypothetical protein
MLNGNSGTVEIDIITLSDKAVELVGVCGRASGKDGPCHQYFLHMADVAAEEGIAMR